MYMKRLEPFLVSMQEYVEVVKLAEVFADISEATSYLWVSNSTHWSRRVYKQKDSQTV
jgi:hypothetical protein